MTLPLLYSYRRCPYAMRARMALLLAALPFTLHEIVLRDKPAAMLDASPKGTVPVLVLPDGRVIDESLDIVQWALIHEAAAPDARGWWVRSQAPALQALLESNDGPFKHHLDRFKYPNRYAAEGADGSALAHLHRAQAVDVLLTPLEALLGAHPFLGGVMPCAADLAIFPFVRQFAAVDPSWFGALPLPGVGRWLQVWLNSPLFHACMLKLPANEPMPYPMTVLSDPAP